MELLLVLCLPRDAETAHLTREVLEASLTTLGVEDEVRGDVNLAVGEACANVVQHADTSDEYEVRVHTGDSRCRIEVIDTGRGFDGVLLDKVAADAAVTAEHGRGLQIIDALAENLQIVNRRQHGAIIRFEIPLSWEPGSPGELLATHASR
ncbi:ATP-binding protein [Actinomadura fulvescens]|uniref:Histidine kinase/HSP90-like ATPase domain-containing protein n=1 Tax=Actinomadura fulvescens TaxID=46160 RepID=A0ABN3Q9G1_9ACTN